MLCTYQPLYMYVLSIVFRKISRSYLADFDEIVEIISRLSGVFIGVDPV